MNYHEPSPVQEAVLEAMLNGEDLLVQAPTGTGKTAAFGIPSIENNDPHSRRIQTLILSPTRELAVQTAQMMRRMCSFNSKVRIQTLYGGEPIVRQLEGLRRNPQIVVATPGRLMDHMRRRTVKLDSVVRVVLDEADRMLDEGFRDEVREILSALPEERQTVLFSATLPPEIRELASEHTKGAREITVGAEPTAAPNVFQYYAQVKSNGKTQALLDLLEEKKFGVSLVFVATKSMADILARQLADAGHSAESLHGDLRQSQRDRVMRRYREGKTSILVATDVASRGIDVAGIDAVINYDIPGDPDSYIHRIGRTGRASASGEAYTFLYAREAQKLKGIMTKTKATILPASGKDDLFSGKGARPSYPHAKQAGRRRPFSYKARAAR